MFFCRTFVVSQFQNASLGKAFELCFRKMPFEKKLWINGRGLWREAVSRFSAKSVFLSAPIKCVAEPFSVSLKVCGEEFYA